jgi:hypothetical protein
MTRATDGGLKSSEDAAKGASSSGSILAVHSYQQGELRQVNFSGARLARSDLEEAVLGDADFLRHRPVGSQFIRSSKHLARSRGRNFIANAPTPRPSRRIVGPNDRESNARVGTAGRRRDRTPRPSRVCASSNTRVARPWWRRARPESPLAEAAAEHRACHSPGKDTPAMRDRRVGHSQGWEKRVADIVVPPPAVLSSREPRRQPLGYHGGAGRLQTGQAFSDGLLALGTKKAGAPAMCSENAI